MVLVIVPVACDSHAVFTDYAQDGGPFLGLYCEDCDVTYPPCGGVGPGTRQRALSSYDAVK